ncbi:MAG: electron transfer flavoprotein subunit alpha [Deltaproteobacteria bacterium]|nr:electron transfer flavoprotein subunit alpha [Deltaproteobacteria bacterium]MBW2071818.1 electron transfer flavoprotein subunit alpha [Deltaproteobacteria bacterium]
MKARVDVDKCIACGECLEVCPVEAIELVEEYVQVNDDCTLCGLCVDVCPEEAISLPELVGSKTEGIEAYQGVWVLSEHYNGKVHSVSYELLGVGRSLADKLGVELTAVVLGNGLTEVSEYLIGYGADRVYVGEHPGLVPVNDEIHARVLSNLIREKKPEIFLAGATAQGRSLVPRVAVAVGTGLTADCTGLDIGEDKLLYQTRPAFGGNVMATIVCPNRRPQMATVRPRVMRKPEFDPRRQGMVEHFTPQEEILQARVRVVKTVLEEQDKTPLADAEVVVTGGRGLQKAENFALIEELAGLLNGAVGASRSVVDEGWQPYSHQVGQTGKTVSPKLYMACGVSGAIQHVVGMQGSEIIVAINKDPHAPIFDVANYGIVADLFEFLPVLVKKIRERRGEF